MNPAVTLYILLWLLLTNGALSGVKYSCLGLGLTEDYMGEWMAQDENTNETVSKEGRKCYYEEHNNKSHSLKKEEKAKQCVFSDNLQNCAL